MSYKCLGNFACFPFNGDIQTSHVPIVSGCDVSSSVQQELENITAAMHACYMKWCVFMVVFLFQRTWQKRAQQNFHCFK